MSLHGSTGKANLTEQKSAELKSRKRHQSPDHSGSMSPDPKRICDVRRQNSHGAADAATNGKTKRSVKDTRAVIESKQQELTNAIAGRLQNHAWFGTTKDLFRGKLSEFQNVQLTGHERKVTDELLRDLGPGARNSIPDDVKKDVVKAVQEFLTIDDDVLRYFKSNRTRVNSGLPNR